MENNMDLINKLLIHEENLAVIGLGYVGMPIAVAFANKRVNVIGFDLNDAKIQTYKSGIDPTNEVGNEAIATHHFCSRHFLALTAMFLARHSL